MDLTASDTTIKPLEKTIGINQDSGSNNDVLHRTPKAQVTKKEKQVNWTSLKLRNILASNDTTVKRMKVTHRMGENIFESYIK